MASRTYSGAWRLRSTASYPRVTDPIGNCWTGWRPQLQSGPTLFPRRCITSWTSTWDFAISFATFYTFQFDWTKMRESVLGSEATFKQLEAEVNSFLAQAH